MHLPKNRNRLQPDFICHYARKQQIEKNSLTQKKSKANNQRNNTDWDLYFVCRDVLWNRLKVKYM